MKNYNLYIVLLVIVLLNNIIEICSASFNIEDNGGQLDNNKNNTDNSIILSSIKFHRFLLNIPDCSVRNVVMDLGTCFNFESYGCLPSSFLIKAKKNNSNKINSNTNSNNEAQDQDKSHQNEFIAIIFYSLNCNSSQDYEVIEFECKKSKKIDLMGNVQLECTSEEDFQPVFLGNEYYSSSSMEKIKIYEELKPLIPNNDDTELDDLNSLSNNSILFNIYLIIISTILVMVVI